jgi:hypothetical protein
VADYCDARGTEQFVWCDINTGINRISPPLCPEHSAELQPAESIAVFEVDNGGPCEYVREGA